MQPLRTRIKAFYLYLCMFFLTVRWIITACRLAVCGRSRACSFHERQPNKRREHTHHGHKAATTRAMALGYVRAPHMSTAVGFADLATGSELYIANLAYDTSHAELRAVTLYTGR